MAADFALFDGQAFFRARGVERAAHGGDRHFLADGDVGSAADNFKGLLAADGDGGAAEAVGIRMLDDRKHFAHDHAAKAAGERRLLRELFQLPNRWR